MTANETDDDLGVPAPAPPRDDDDVEQLLRDVRLLTVRQTLRVLNVSRATLYRRVTPAGEWGDVLRPLKIGRSTRFASSDVEALLRIIRRQGGAR